MNTVVTSREEILKTAVALARKEGCGRLGMRTVAGACGIAVGSVYNYFPTKEELLLAVVGEIWREIFHSLSCDMTSADFLTLVEGMQENIRQGIEKYPGFFADHAYVVSDRKRGRDVMLDYIGHMEEALVGALGRDKGIRKEIWSESFTQRDFAAFIMDFLKEDLIRGESRDVFLRELICRLLYD